MRPVDPFRFTAQQKKYFFSAQLLRLCTLNCVRLFPSGKMSAGIDRRRLSRNCHDHMQEIILYVVTLPNKQPDTSEF